MTKPEHVVVLIPAQADELTTDVSKMQQLSSFNYSKFFRQTLHFVAHCIGVLLFLCCGAIIFASLEEPTTSANIAEEHNTTLLSDISTIDDLVASYHNFSFIWNRVSEKYVIHKHVMDDVVMQVAVLDRKICELLGKNNKPLISVASKFAAALHHEEKKSRGYIFFKWFYFATISTTTIGYGHVHPRTDNGKLFYIFFSIIGITLMMTLLKSCGTILRTINSKIMALHTFDSESNLIGLSKEFLAVVSMVVMFCLFMVLVVLHDQCIGLGNSLQWSVIDTIYFWIVTFTTVGFGDVHFSLDIEIDHVCELFFYRVFGLSFLAAIIDSMHVYLQSRKAIIAKRGYNSFLKFKRKLSISGV